MLKKALITIFLSLCTFNSLISYDIGKETQNWVIFVLDRSSSISKDNLAIGIKKIKLTMLRWPGVKYGLILLGGKTEGFEWVVPIESRSHLKIWKALDNLEPKGTKPKDLGLKNIVLQFPNEPFDTSLKNFQVCSMILGDLDFQGNEELWQYSAIFERMRNRKHQNYLLISGFVNLNKKESFLGCPDKVGKEDRYFKLEDDKEPIPIIKDSERLNTKFLPCKLEFLLKGADFRSLKYPNYEQRIYAKLRIDGRVILKTNYFAQDVNGLLSNSKYPSVVWDIDPQVLWVKNSTLFDVLIYQWDKENKHILLNKYSFSISSLMLLDSNEEIELTTIEEKNKNYYFNNSIFLSLKFLGS